MLRAKTSTGAKAQARTAKRVKPTRAEKNQLTRDSLFEAAAKVVGKEGYANAMVAMVAAEAKVAHGTFYNYFESRQDLFDQLLPELGREMLQFIREEAAESANGLEREERSFRAFFTFLKMKPEFYRILYEAELFAPTAFKSHMEAVTTGYVSQLQRAAQKGELKAAEGSELEAVAYMLMGVRHYLCMRYAHRDGSTVSLPEWVVRSYMNFVTDGIYNPASPRR